MDASNLDRAIRDLSSSLSSLNRWLVGMTAIVTVGLLVEYIPELKERLEKFREAGAWRSLTTRHSLAWKPLAILLGAVLVTGGVAGEMLFEGLSFHKEGQLESAHAEVEDSLRQQAQSAEMSAEKAAVAADAAQSRANAAGTAADNAAKEAGVADQRVKEVATQANRIGGMLGETIALVNARRVENGGKLSAELKAHFKGRKIQLVSYAGDLEAFGLCEQLVNAAKNAGMVPEDICGKAWFTSPIISPLSITAPTWDETLEISRFLLDSGNIGGTTGLTGPNLVIFVGVKSPVMLGETAQTRDVERRAAAMKRRRRPKTEP